MPARRAKSSTLPPPTRLSNSYVYMTSALPPVFTLIGFSTLIFIQPPSPHQFELQTLNSNPPTYYVYIVFISLTTAPSTEYLLTWDDLPLILMFA